MRAALTDATGNVVNVIVPGTGYTPPQGLAVHDLPAGSPVGPGWKRTAAGKWDAPPPEPTRPPAPNPLADLRAELDVLIDDSTAPTQPGGRPTTNAVGARLLARHAAGDATAEQLAAAHGRGWISDADYAAVR